MGIAEQIATSYPDPVAAPAAKRGSGAVDFVKELGFDAAVLGTAVGASNFSDKRRVSTGGPLAGFVPGRDEQGALYRTRGAGRSAGKRKPFTARFAARGAGGSPALGHQSRRAACTTGRTPP